MKPPTKAALAKLPPLQRAFAEQQQARDGRSDRLGVFTVGNGGGGTCCADAHAIQQAGAAMWGGKSLITWLVLVVPDGVAKVTVLLPARKVPVPASSSARCLSPPGCTTTSSQSRSTASMDDPLHYMIWYGQTGNFVKKFRGNTHNL